MATQRVVRVAQSFFARLDVLLPEQRSVGGEPSATDFLVHDLPPIVDRLAASYEDVTTEVPGAPEIRAHITHGVLVGQLVIYAVLTTDGAIELIHLDIDH